MTKLIILTFLAVVVVHFTTTAQMEGDQLVLGYWGPSGTDQSVMFIDFRSGEPEIIKHAEIKIWFSETGSNICTESGEPLLWTNGMQIMDYTGNYIADTISYDGKNGYWDYFYLESYELPIGFPKLDGAVILPVPETSNEYSVIYHYGEEHPVFGFAVTQYLEARIVWSQDSEFILRYKDKPIGPRVEWYTGNISAVKHANGRDWWLVSFKEDSPEYYAHLLDPSGIQLDHIGQVDTIVREGLGQAVFSSKGNYFARMDAIGQAEGEFITLYTFDRCDGTMTRLKTFNTPSGVFTGVAFSPSEQFLYADNNTKLWQWDLWSEDIAASQVLIDSFDGFEQPNWGPMRFGPMVSAPDGRIYIVPSAGSSKYLHVIDRPDLPDTSCRFLQHHINLEIWNGRSAPNIPNFRLGPLDDNHCDTLGINNLPVSRWRYEVNNADDPLSIRFTDLSFFDPQHWHWDFDDGSQSEEKSPVHEFEPGLYHVCLTVTNEYATDSSCQWVEVMSTSIREEINKLLPDISITPNPFVDYIEFHSPKDGYNTSHLQLYDVHGRLIFDDPSVIIPSKLFLPDFPPGMYICNLTDEDGKTFSFKLMKK